MPPKCLDYCPMTIWLFNPKSLQVTVNRLRLTVTAALWLLASSQTMAADTPTFTDVKATHPSAYAELNDRQGDVLARRRVDMAENRLAWIALDDISPAVIEAVIFAFCRSSQARENSLT